MKKLVLFVAVVMMGSMLVPAPADAGIFQRLFGRRHYVAAPAQTTTSGQAQANQRTRRFSYQPGQVQTRRYSAPSRDRGMSRVESRLHPGSRSW